MLKLKGKLDFTLFVKVEGVDPVNGKRPNRNIKKKFLTLGIAIIIGMLWKSIKSHRYKAIILNTSLINNRTIISEGIDG